MSRELEIIREIEVLESRGKHLRSERQASSSDRDELDSEAFHQWRVAVNKMLFSTLGASNQYYQCFWKTVGKPSFKDLDEGLRLLALVRNELEGVFPSKPLYCAVPDPAARDDVTANG